MDFPMYLSLEFLWVHGPVVDANMVNQARPEADCVKLPICNLFNWWNFLKQMFSQDNQVLDIYNAVTPGHRANVTQWIVFTPVFGHDHNILHIDDLVAVKVNDRAN